MESRLFDTSTVAGIKKAERYKARLNNKYVRVTVITLGFNSVKIVGAVLLARS